MPSQLSQPRIRGGSQRVFEMKTGKFQPDDDEHPGVYIRNEKAIVWAADLRKLLEYEAPQARKQAVLELVELLESVK